MKTTITNEDIFDALTDVDDSRFTEIIDTIIALYIDYVGAEIDDMPSVRKEIIACKQHYDITKSDRFKPFNYFATVAGIVIGKYHVGDKPLKYAGV